MHFFIDPTQLKAQSTSTPSPDSYGPVAGHLNAKFDVSAQFKLDNPADAFICQDGMVMVTNHLLASGALSPDLCNVILKPSDGLIKGLPRVKYYIYRGLRLDSFLDAADLISEANATTEFMIDFWIWYNGYKLANPGIPAANPTDIGFSIAQGDATHVEDIFHNTVAGLKAFKVTEGTHLGQFDSSSKIAFEVILDDDLLEVNLGYVKKNLIQVDVSPGLANNAPTPTDLFAIKMQREAILAYLDPAVLYALYQDQGVWVSEIVNQVKIPTLMKGDDIITSFLSKFETYERLYIDIRSEKGYSYNLYENYGTAVPVKLLKVKQESAAVTDDAYLVHDWPIHIRPSWPSSKKMHRLELQLRVDDNTAPLLYLENKDILRKVSSKPFLDKKALLNGAAVDWTKPIKIKVPNHGSGANKANIAHIVRMQYFRTAKPPAGNTKLLKQDNHLDRLFGGLNLTGFSTGLAFQKLTNDKVGLAWDSGYAFYPENGVYMDGASAVLYAKKRHHYEQVGDSYPKIDTSALNVSVVANSIFPKNIVFNRWLTQEAPLPGTDVNLIEIVGYQSGAGNNRKDDIFLLGLTKPELTKLHAVGGFGPGHQRYLKFLPQANTEDINGIPLQKYKVVVQGLDPTGTQHEDPPAAPDVYVYGLSNTMFCSKAFAAIPALPQVLPDPGTITRFANAHTFSYDKTDGDVQAVEATGMVTLADKGNNYRDDSPLAHLQADVAVPENPAVVNTIAPGTFPVIVIANANGGKYTDYAALLEFLAKNGFIVVAIDCFIRRVQIATVEMKPKIALPQDHKFSWNGTNYEYNPVNNKVFTHPAGVDTGWVKGTDFEIIAAVPKRVDVYFKLTANKFTYGGTNYEFKPATNKVFTDPPGPGPQVDTGWVINVNFRITPGPNSRFEFISTRNGVNEFEYLNATYTYIPATKKVFTKPGHPAAPVDTTWVEDVDFKLVGPTGIEIYNSFPISTPFAFQGKNFTYNSLTQKVFTAPPAVVADTGMVQGTDFNILVGLPREIELIIDSFSMLGRDFAYLRITKKIFLFPKGPNPSAIMPWTLNTEFKIITAPSRQIDLIDIPELIHGMGIRGRTQLIYKHLDILRRKFAGSIENKIGLFGHSRGGEAVVRAVDNALIAGAGLHATLNDFKGVMSLAPTDLWDKEDLDRNVPYFVLYGSHDGDVSGMVGPGGRQAGPAGVISGSGGFSLYDRASNNTFKSMAFVDGASHNGFITANDHNVPPNHITPVKQKEIVKAYANAYFRRVLHGETVWDPYLADGRIPGSITYKKIYFQHQNMDGSAKEVDSFEGAIDKTKTSKNETVTFSGAAADLEEGVLRPRFHAGTIDELSPHFTQGMIVKWNNGNTLAFNVKNTLKDVSALEYFSFRITHKADTALALGAYPKIDTLQIEVEDTAGGKHKEGLTRNVPEPIRRPADGRLAPPFQLVKSALMTIRIPLASYGANGVDLTKVKKVTFHFPAAGGPGTIELDSLEFTN